LVGSVAGGIGPVLFSGKAGEMLGLTGFRGAGQETIGRAIFGLIAFTAGNCLLDGKEVTISDPTESIAHGLRFASGDRRAESVVQGFSIAENLLLNPCINDKAVLSPIHPAAERRAARRLGAFLQLSPNDPQAGPMARPQGQASSRTPPPALTSARRARSARTAAQTMSTIPTMVS
jgi:ribose transport system ATP-binding protein